MFSGQGEQYPGMGKDLYRSQPYFKGAVQDCADILAPQLDTPLIDYIFNADADAQQETFVTQLIVFTIDYALARMWMSFGLEPGCVIGHSLGEYAAGCIAGMFDLESGLKMVLHRGQLMQDFGKEGAMAAVFADLETVRAGIGRLSEGERQEMAVASVNGPRKIVVSGSADVLGHLLQILEAEGVRAQYLRVKRAFHSPLIAPIQEKYRAVLAKVDFKEAQIPLMSTVLVKKIKEADSDYWLQHNIEPVLFYPAVEALYSSGYSTFLEVGPGRTLTNLTKAVVKREATVVPSLDSRKNDWQAVYQAAAELLAGGADINPYHGRDGYRRLELPTYPFERKSFWIKQDFGYLLGGANTQPSGHPLNPSVNHPLIDGCSFLSEQKAVYYKRLVFEDRLFQDHIIRETPTIAGFVWLEAVYQAGTDFEKRAVTGMKDVMFLTPFQLKQGQVGRIEIVIERRGEEVEFLVRSQIEGGDPEGKTHARGSLRTAPLPKARNIDPGDIRSRCTETIPGQTLYAHYREKAGIEHGPFFRGVQKVDCAADELLIEMGLPEAIEQTSSGYNYHPGLMDSAIQGIYALTFGQEKSNYIRQAFIPFYFQEVLFYAPVNRPCLAYARLTKDTDEITRFEIAITDKKGRVMARIVDAASKRVPYEDLSPGNREVPMPVTGEADHWQEWFFWLKWEETDFAGEVDESPKKWLIFADNGPIHSRLLSRLSSLEHQYRVVFPAAQFDNVKLLESVSHELADIDGIIFLWPFQEFTAFDLDKGRGDQDNWVSALLLLAQELIRKKISLDLWIMTSFAQTVCDKEENLNPLKAILWGMAGVINREIPSVSCRCIDVNPLTAEFDVDGVLREIRAREKPERVLYYQGHRYLPRVQKADFAGLMRGGFLLKEHGVYVISGGLGAIGRQIARDLARRVRVNLVLIGQKPLPPEDKWQEYIKTNTKDNETANKIEAVLEMRTLAADVMVSATDITDFRQTGDLFGEIKKRFGRIDGIIHAAGINEDALIVNKDILSFNRVLAAKVQGAWNLDVLTASEDLDFFVMFSSMAALDGNISQVDYAGANAFLDAFARWRGGHRKGVSLSIDWGLWNNVGMAAQGHTVKQAQRSGVIPIEVAEGVKAFNRVLYGVGGQILIDPNIPREQEISSPAKFEANSREIEFDGTDRQDFLEKVLIQMVAAYIDTEPSEIDKEDLTFLELGMDSENLVEMIQKLEDRFDIKLYPTVFFEYQTIDELSGHLLAKFPDEIAGKLQAAVQTSSRVETANDNRHVEPPPPPAHDRRIAIIGYSLRVPGANSADEFWHNLSSGVESVTDIPANRWPWQAIYDPQPGVSGRSYCKRGAFLDDVDRFDPQFFNISPKEAVALDPKQRLFLEVGWECLEHAGCCGEQANQRTGVFVGASYSYYYDSLPSSERRTTFAATGNGLPLIANRFSFFMNFNGPSILVDTYCSSSLVALHMACRSLQGHECDMALVGGVHAPLVPDHYMIMSEMEALSPDGQCRTFDDRANGYVPGEGVVAVLLKPLARAIDDNDYIHGVIAGSAVNHDGHSNHITAPSAVNQGRVITDAVKDARIDPETISYIEAHGTGTPLGDPVELEGLVQAFSGFTHKESFCALGSVKSNIGHLEPASGLAGLVKIILSLKVKKIPPTLHFHKLNRFIDFSHTPFYIADQMREWQLLNGVRRAGLSSFGLAGANAHVIVEEAPGYAPPSGPADLDFPVHILTLSARNRETLEQVIRRCKEYLVQRRDWSLPEVCYTASTGRKHFSHRAAFVVTHREDLLDKLSEAAALFRGEARKRAPLVFAFTGHLEADNRWKQLYDKNSLFKASLEELAESVAGITDFPLVEALSGAASTGTQAPGQRQKLLDFALSFALAQVVIHLGVKPDFTYGSGSGEYIAAAVSGKYSLEDAVENMLQDNRLPLRGDCPVPFLSPEKFADKGVVLLSFGDPGRQTAPSIPAVTFYPQEGEEWRAMIDTVAALYVKGVEINWKTFYQDRLIRKIPLPTYPFQHKSYWLQEYETGAGQPAGTILEEGETAEPAEQEAEGDIEFYRRCWQPIKIVEAEPFVPGNAWLLFADSAELSADLKGMLEINDQKVITVRAGETFTQEDARHFGINPQAPDDYSRLREAVRGECGEIAGILYLWSPPLHQDWLECPGDELEMSFYAGVYPLFLIIKTFLTGAAASPRPPKIFALCPGAVQSVNDSVFLTPDASAKSALLKTAASELACPARLIALDTGSLSRPQTVETIMKEIGSARDVPEVMYRGDRSFTSAVEPVPAIEEGSRPLLKEGGVYLIVGGSSGIGARTALYLASHFKARLIIVGRTLLPGQEEWDQWLSARGGRDSVSRRIEILKEIVHRGGDCLYLSADVADLAQMQQVIGKARAKYGHIDGLIHSGGIIEDALIENKSFASFQRVWRAKTVGSAVLHRLTGDENLDFFVVFSSLSAVFGNPGQADYAAANAFMDALMIERSRTGRGRSLGINWSYWQEGGMDISPVGLKQMRAKGLLPLDSRRALEAFRSCLEQGGDEGVIVVNQIGDFSMAAVSDTTGPAQAGHSTKRTEEFLGQLIKDLLFIDHDELDPDSHFEEFGVDSLTMKKMVRKVEGFIQGPVEPSSLLEYPTIRSLARHLGEPPVNKTVPAPRVLENAGGFTAAKSVENVKSEDRGDWKGKEVAVIGFACRFPGAPNIEEFWKNLSGGVSSITEVPKERWDIDRFYSPDPADPDRTYCRWGGFIQDVDQFDPSLFSIKEDDAAMIDPQQRIALEIAWETFEHAGYNKQKVWGSRTGVFFGARADRYEGERRDPQVISGFLTGQLTNFISARISDFFNLKGPSMTMDTACSSSLVSTHYAYKSLQFGECDAALAGGTELKITPHPFITLSTAQALSSTGKSFVFDKKADGFVPGEGVGAVLLKLLSRALRDRDHVYAVIKGSAVNNDGHTMGITTPNLEAQKEVIQSALKDSGLNPETISYVEAHGTGTLIGDPIEIKALTKVYERYTNRKGYCAVGSVKTNIGHLDTAAGIASLIKVVLSFVHRQIPPTLHCTEPNPRFSFVDSPFYPNATSRAWTPMQGVRRAGMSSFGFGGTNCHMILEEPPPAQDNPGLGASNPSHLFTLSARTNRAIGEFTSRYRAFLESTNDLDIEDICFTAAVGREPLSFRRAFICKDTAELKEKLVNGDGDLHYVPQHQPPQVVFMFPGQGALYPGMVKELYRTVPAFARALDSCSEILTPYWGQPLHSYLDRADMDVLKETAVTQPLTFAVNYSLADMWRQWGLIPRAVLGHSIGEYTAACIAGVFSLEDAIKIVYNRGRLMQERCQRGSMAVFFTDMDRLEGLFSSLSPGERQQVAVAAVNGPANMVISGETPVIRRVVDLARSQRVRSHMLHVSHAFHSPLMEPMLGEFARVFDEVEIKENTIPLFNNVDGRLMEREYIGKEYWLKQVMSPVQFAESIAQAVLQGANIFVESGPGTTLRSMVRRLPTDKEVYVCASLDSNRGDWQSIMDCVADLYVRGVNFDFEKVFPDYGQRIALPTYPFERQSYWSFSADDRVDSPGKRNNGRQVPPGFDRCTEFSPQRVVFAKDFSARGDPLLADHMVQGAQTLPGVYLWEMAFQAAKGILQDDQICLQEVVHKAPVMVERGKGVCSQVKVEKRGDTLKFEIYHRAEGTSAWTENCSGKMARLQVSPPEGYNIREIEERLSASSMSAADIYDYFSSIGLDYGEGFRSIRDIRGNRHEVLASLELPDRARDYPHQFSYHPALLDAALQSIVGIMLMNRQVGGTYIPFFVEEILFYRPLPARCTSYVRLVETKTSDIIKGNAEILDESGEVVVEIKHFSLKKTPPRLQPDRGGGEDGPSASTVDLSHWLYKPGLTAKPLAAKGEPREVASLVLFLHRNTGHEALARQLEEAGVKIIRVYPAETYSQLGLRAFTLNIRESKDYEMFFQALQEHQTGIYHYMHLWTLGDEKPENDNLEQLEEGLYRGIYSLFFISKNLEKSDKGREKVLCILSPLSEMPDGGVSAISGFVRSLGLEYNDFSLSHIYVDPEGYTGADTVKNLIEELKFGADGVVFYKENERWLESLEPLSGETGEFPVIAFRDKGVYLITGGLGGIGREIGKYLAQKYRAKLVLMDREPLIPRREWDAWLSRHSEEDGVSKKILSVREMERWGAEVLVVGADVADLASIEQCIGQVKSQFGAIHGAIHTAGVLRDGLFHNLDFDQFREALIPKVHGSLVLDRVLAADNLDFMILFSGAVTAFGNVGQSNYVAANSFLDAFARLRQHKNRRTMVLNWWFWGEAGFIDRFDHLKTLKSKGFELLTNRQAIWAFEHMMKSGEVRVIMKQPDEPAINTDAQVEKAGRREPDQKKTFNIGSIKDYLAQKIGRMTKSKIGKELFGRSFMDIGLDSLVLVNLANDLEQEINIRLYPTVFFEYNTVDKLAEFLFDEHRQELERSLVAVDREVSVRETREEAQRQTITEPPGEEPADIAEVGDDEPLEAGEMRAVFIEKPGTLQHFVVGKTPIPKPADRQIRLKVMAAGINFSDVLTVLGRYPNAPSFFPHVLGNEVAGVVDGVGSQVRRFRPGQEVLALTRGYGGFAEYVVTDEDSAIMKPGHISFAEAATFPVVFLTAYHALYYLGRIEGGEKIFIQGAGGGVGLMAVQLAKLAGAEILAAAGSAEKLDYLKEIGVPHTINYRSADVVSEIKRLTANGGVDLILTSSARDEVEPMMSVLAPNGRFLEMGMVGLRDSGPLDFSRFVDNQSFFSIDLKRLKPALIRSHLNRLQEWLAQKKIRPIAHKSYPYRDVKRAFQFISMRKNIGKVVLGFPPKGEAKAPLKPTVTDPGIAIVGLGCRFPAAENYRQFWQNLAGGVDSITNYPQERARFTGVQLNGRETYWGGFLEDVEKFDCAFFNISPAEAAVMDPQQRLFLTTAWEAVEDAGYGGTDALPRETGIFVGVSRQDYQKMIDQEANPYKGHAVIGNTHSILPSRLAYFLDLRGPAIAINTACSSSLVAVHDACQSLRRRECKMALAGGVNLCLTPDSVKAFEGMGALSPAGRCKAFDYTADGFVSAEGAGVVVLKLLEDAREDRDYVYAVIKGSALNNDGYSNGITAPNPVAQAEVIHQALENAGTPPESISYIEAHGTGTQLGDPIEVEALCKVFGDVPRKAACAIGSVKTNIGHTETAAGVAGIIKTVLAIRHGVIPPSIHFHRSNPAIDFTQTPFYVNDRLSAWGSNGFPLRAGVSSFGFSGTNAHLVVEQPPAESLEDEADDSPVLFTLSAKTGEELTAFARKMGEFLERDEQFKLADIGYSANIGKRPLKYRLALVAASKEQLARDLAGVTQAEAAKAGSPLKLVFVFPESHGESHGDLRLPLNEEIFDEHRLAQEHRAAWQTFSRQYGLAKLLQSWGILPAAVLGFGVGQYAALATAGVISPQDAFAMIGQSKQRVAYLPAQIPVISPRSLTVSEDTTAAAIVPPSPDLPSLTGIRSRLQAWGVDDLLEIGPDRLGDEPLFTDGKSNERQAIYSCLAWAFCRGFELNWQEIYSQQGQGRRRVPLPTYPFQEKPHWFMGSKEVPGNREPDREQEVPALEAEIPDGAIDRQVPVIRDILSRTLGIDPAEIEADTHFGEYGMDSMLMKQAVVLLEGHYKMPIQANILYEYPNLESLAAYFARLAGDPADRSGQREEPADPLMDILDRFLDDGLSIGEAQEQILRSLK